MKTIIIDNHFKKITIAYEPRNRLSRHHIADEIQAALEMTTDYTEYCYLLRLQGRLADVTDTLTANALFWTTLC